MFDLDIEIAKTLAQYTQEIQEALEEATDKITLETIKYLKATSPTRTHKYKRYYLTHLLEHGHAKRGGGRVLGIKHIEPAEQKAIDAFEQELRRAIDDIR